MQYAHFPAEKRSCVCVAEEPIYHIWGEKPPAPALSSQETNFPTQLTAY